MIFIGLKEFEQKLIVVAADCTGHGVPGAFMSMLGVAFLNEIIKSTTNDPAIEELTYDYMPIGYYFEEKPFTQQEIQLAKNDIIYLFSDGFIDQFDEVRKKKFLSYNFKKLLLDIHKKEMKEQLLILEDTFTKYRGNYRQIDDVLVIGMKI